MIKEIKPTDKIGDSRVLINVNFKELDERLKKVERGLKTRKSKRSKK
ncbi:MAG: hypothetical protein Q8R12_04950 [bacterium]|nr:hypothetical protein [bacterium]